MAETREIHVTRALTIAMGSAAYFSLGVAEAVPVRFDNDGSFDAMGNILDMTLPAAAQTGAGNPYALGGTQVRLGYGYDVYTPYYSQSYSTLDSDVGVAVRSNPSLFIKAFAAGELVGSSADFLTGGRTLFERYESCWDIYYGGSCTVSYPGDFVNDGTIQYAGVQLDIGGLIHYGWVGIRTVGYAYNAEIVSWGYETEPGVAVPAGIPAPSTLAGLALGAAAFGRRPRRD